MRKISLALLVTVLLAGLFSCNNGNNPKSGACGAGLDSLLAIGKFTPELLWKLGRVGEFSLSPDSRQLAFGLTKYNLKKNKGNTDIYLLPLDGGALQQLTSTAGGEYNIQWRPDGKKIGFIASRSGSSRLWEMDADGSFQKAISPEGTDYNGFIYSPAQDHILLIREVKTDKNPQEVYPDLPKSNVRIIDDMMYRHWDAWYEYTHSHLFIASYENGKIGTPLDLMPDEPYDAPVKPDGGIEQICWSPDGKKLAYTCKKLKGKAYALSTNTDIYLYDLESRKTLNLSEGMPGYDKDPVFSPDGKRIVWRSMATPGFESDKDRIMVYHFENGSIKDYSAQFDQSSSNFQWKQDGNTLYFISGIHATYQIYTLDLTTDSIRQLTGGDHNYIDIRAGNGMLVGTKMSIGMPAEIFVIDPESGKETQLSFINTHILNKIELAKVEKRWIKTTDGKDMLTWVILPPGFDPSKKYPALLYCQGGPQSAVSQFFSYRWNFQMMAANGYIVVAPNRRGLPTFGQEWNDQISGDYGGQNIQDYLSAIDAVAAEPYVDKDHLGAVGASYGGYSVFWLAGHHEGRFKAFISHCGMYNLESQYGATEEFFFVNHDLGGPYWQEPQPVSYNYSPHRYVGKWDTPILIISGGYDFRIPYTESLQAFNAAQLRGIPSKLLFFPEETHFVLKPQNSVLWQREFFGWLDRWLKQ
ncbi:MAG TPA: S9 family peptidase [Bacteroidales bacterium]|nr:S9 family peptidase [Bacteroidales bacterium]HSA42656.1 S9 family peptidase [Bacteroidales bacterium]